MIDKIDHLHGMFKACLKLWICPKITRVNLNRSIPFEAFFETMENFRSSIIADDGQDFVIPDFRVARIVHILYSH